MRCPTDALTIALWGRGSPLTKEDAGGGFDVAPELAHVTLHGEDGPSFLGEEEGHCHFLGVSHGAWSFAYMSAA